MAETLKNCPFCGGVPDEYVTGNVCCMTAGCAMFAVHTPRPMWDRRAPGPATTKMLDWTRGMLETWRARGEEPSPMFAAFLAEHEPAGPIQP